MCAHTGAVVKTATTGCLIISMKSLIIELAILKLEAPYIFLEYINEEARAD